MSLLLPGYKEPRPALVRAVSAFEELEAARTAHEEARKRGMGTPEAGDERFDVPRWAAIVAKAFLDADSPIEGREPYFETVAEVLDLPLDSISYLFQVQQAWQEEVSPSYKARSIPELIEAVKKVAETDGEVFFSRCSPLMQLHLSRFMASRLVSSPSMTSPSTSPSSGSTARPSSGSSKGERRRSRAPKRA